MGEEVGWTVDGFSRIDRALTGHPGLKDLDAAYRRLRERNPRLRAKARELALLGTRALEDGTLEWKFDAMLSTIAIDGTIPPRVRDGALAPHRRADAARPRRGIGRVLAQQAGRGLPRARGPGAPAACFRDTASSRSPAPGTWCTSIARASCCARCENSSSATTRSIANPTRKETPVFDLKGKVAIVTGGNGGIGLGMARGLARPAPASSSRPERREIGRGRARAPCPRK